MGGVRSIVFVLWHMIIRIRVVDRAGKNCELKIKEALHI